VRIADGCGLERGMRVEVVAGLAGGSGLSVGSELSAGCGVHLVPVNTHLSPSEIGYIVRDCGARLVIADAALAEAGKAALDAIGYPEGDRIAADDQPGGRPLSALLDGMPGELPDNRVNAQIMLYTSGTTGRPKGVVYPVSAEITPERAIAAVSPIMARRGMRTGPDAISLVTGPLYHGAPGAWGLQGLHHGHSVMLMGRWDSEQVLALIERERVTTAQMAPIHFFRLLQLPEHVRGKRATGRRPQTGDHRARRDKAGLVQAAAQHRVPRLAAVHAVGETAAPRPSRRVQQG
jgi:acyl-CoA synthetase (AMP-forming)/AMP-acid ligase II